MKLITLLCISLAITTGAAAQIKKGQFLIGGNISFESIENEGNYAANYETKNFFVSPNIGYFIIEKLAGGLRFDLRSYRSTSPNNYRQTNTSVSPFIRYYFLPSTKNINVFIDLGYLSYKSKYTNMQPQSSSYKDKSSGYSISAGPVMFLTKQVALEFILGYKYIKADGFNDYKSSTFNTGLGLQIHLGKEKVKGK